MLAQPPPRRPGRPVTKGAQPASATSPARPDSSTAGWGAVERVMPSRGRGQGMGAGMVLLVVLAVLAAGV